jgi:hypothetical protein
MVAEFQNMTFSLFTDTVVMMGVLVAVVLVGNSCACLILTVLEPFFNAAASQFILGQQIPVTLWLSLAPIVLGKLTRFVENPAAILHCLCCFLCRQ